MLLGILYCRDAKIQFTKYAVPLLALSGIDYTVVEVLLAESSSQTCHLLTAVE